MRRMPATKWQGPCNVCLRGISMYLGLLGTIGFLFFGILLSLIFGSVGMLLGIAGFLFFGIGLGYKIIFKWETVQKRSRVQATLLWAVLTLGSVYITSLGYQKMGPSRVQDTESAQRFLVGVWTYTSPLDSKNEYVQNWIKWDIGANGTMQTFYAYPRDNNWGKSEQKEYKIITNKYSDTGERYYAIVPKGGAEIAVILANGRLAYSILGEGTVFMKRGDRFPFSQ